MRKRIIVFLVALVMCFSVAFMAACSPTTSEQDPPNVPEVPVTPDVPVVPEVPVTTRIPAPSKFLYEDFSDGLKTSKFYINQNKWGSPEGVNNGVIGKNVSYTSDGIVIMKANGDLYDEASEKRAGSCLLSREVLGPGKYEVAMKVMPRLGGCSAIWPMYSNESKWEYTEIDIEIPAGAAGNDPATFEKSMFTNYSTPANRDGEIYGNGESQKKETLTPANDGRWHKYTIEWHTNPKKIIYKIDDVEYATATAKVPVHTAPLQIGVWFPNSWAGDPNFETGYMLVDWVSYEPFTAEPSSPGEVTESGLYAMSEYPTTPVALPASEYIANGDFEHTTTTDVWGNNKPAWVGIESTMLVSGAEANINKKTLMLNASQSVSQIISGVYAKERISTSFGGFGYASEFDLKGTFKLTTGSKAKIQIDYLNDKNESIATATVHELTEVSSRYKNFSYKVKAANNCKKIKISLICSQGKAYLDAIKLQLIEPKTAAVMPK